MAAPGPQGHGGEGGTVVDLLVIDTCTERLLAGVRFPGSGADRWANLDAQGNHARDILPVVQRLLEGRRPQAVGVALGPGSFTGVRIGLATARGLAAGWKVPIVGLDNLAAMAGSWGRLRPGDASAVLPVIDARKKKFYGALYRANQGLVAPQDLSPHEWVTQVLEVWSGPVAVSGYQGHLLAEALGELPQGWSVLETSDWMPELLDEAQALARAGRVLADDAGPRYLRLSEAEEALRQRST